MDKKTAKKRASELRAKGVSAKAAPVAGSKQTNTWEVRTEPKK
jgi:hypothetical protein